ncbi:MAG TPA: hypothetical protein VN797_09080 [Gemmatimonadaceae bacterium]|nr:hypothetical protein [Gemmatimonadaceae bacterium]
MESPFASLPGTRRTRKRSPTREAFELPVGDGSSVLVDGWIPDMRYSQDVRVTLPDGRILRIEGFRYGWFVWMDHDPHNMAGGELTGCIADVVGSWDENQPDEWPDWLSSLERRLGARDRGREKPAN